MKARRIQVGSIPNPSGDPDAVYATRCVGNRIIIEKLLTEVEVRMGWTDVTAECEPRLNKSGQSSGHYVGLYHRGKLIAAMGIGSNSPIRFKVSGEYRITKAIGATISFAVSRWQEQPGVPWLVAIQKAYLVLLRTKGSFRVGIQEELCQLRDSIAGATGRDIESVQNEYESLALTLGRCNR